ncbi:MAG: MASE1 domain-containing protein [Hyphomicrobium sp.]|nr:MASE1 domain-containing protein [Hyphomicrobium sp.]
MAGHPRLAGAFRLCSENRPLGLPLEISTSAVTGASMILPAVILRRIEDFNRRLPSVSDVVAFVLIVGSVTALAAVGYTLALSAAGALGRGEFGPVSWRLFVGNFIGIIVIAPAVFILQSPPNRPFRWRWVVQLLAISAALMIIFGYREATAFQLFYLLFLPLLWVALTSGSSGAIFALVVIQCGLVIGAEFRFGADPGLTALQVLMIALTITGLLVGAAFTERETTAARMRDQQISLSRALRLRAAGEIAAGIAHEVNQPLAAIRAYASVAEGQLQMGDTEAALGILRKLSLQSARAAEVIKSIRELLHQGAINPHPADLTVMLQEFAELVAPELASNGAQLTIEVSPGLPPISVDRVQIIQALHNLVNNSAEAIASTGRRGAVQIRTAMRDNKTVSILVADNGPGFPVGFSHKHPTPFFTTKDEGTGIGLSIARTVAEMHGGRLLTKSDLSGASVEIILPAAES